MTFEWIVWSNEFMAERMRRRVARYEVQTRTRVNATTIPGILAHLDRDIFEETVLATGIRPNLG